MTLNEEILSCDNGILHCNNERMTFVLYFKNISHDLDVIVVVISGHHLKSEKFLSSLSE